MQWLFTKESVLYLIPFIFSLCILAYLLLKPRKSAGAWCLVGFYASLCGVFLIFFIERCLFGPIPVSLGTGLLLLSTLTFACFLQYIYRFPQNPFAREAQISLYISLLIVPLPVFIGQVAPTMEALALVLCALAMVVWAVAIVLRKMAYFVRLENPKAFEGNFRSILRNIVRSRETKSRATLSLLSGFVPLLGTVLCLMIYELDFVSLEIYEFAMNTCFLFLLAVNVHTYLNLTLEPSSFLVKIAGMYLIALLVAFSMLCRHEANTQRTVYQNRLFEILAKIEHQVHIGEVSSFPRDVRYVISFSGDGLSEVVLARDDLDRGRTLKETLERRSALIERLSHGGEPIRPERRDGFAFSVSDTYISYFFSQGGRLYEVGFSYLQYRKFMDDKMRELTWNIVGGSLIVLFIIPLSLRPSLILPLKRLLDGVGAVNEGRLDVVEEGARAHPGFGADA